ncbi:MAG: molybdopterin-binding protein [Aggregatilineales bacterium]
MQFGEIAVMDALDTILAHKLYDDTGKMIFNKGHRLLKDDLAVLQSHNIIHVTVARLDISDLHEDAAARRIGQAIAGKHVAMKSPGVGRANLSAEKRGILHINAPALTLLNNITDGITIATLREYTLVDPQKLLALVKIVPFGVPEARVVDIERIAAETMPILQVRPLIEKQVALIISGTDATKERLMKSFIPPVKNRIEGWGSHLLTPQFVQHEQSAITEAIRKQRHADMILIASVSAIIDRADLVPAALVESGGSITIHGMPVDPGSLLMLGYLGDTPVVGAPGCIKSPRKNVVDMILPRLLTGERLTRANLVSMGHGGLLDDIRERPMPRE